MTDSEVPYTVDNYSFSSNAGARAKSSKSNAKGKQTIYSEDEGIDIDERNTYYADATPTTSAPAADPCR